MEANPGRVNDRDRGGETPLIAAGSRWDELSMVVWLLDEKGADVNANGCAALELPAVSQSARPDREKNTGD